MSRRQMTNILLPFFTIKIRLDIGTEISSIIFCDKRKIIWAVKVQISLRICIVWSGTLLSANRIIGYSTENVWMKSIGLDDTFVHVQDILNLHILSMFKLFCLAHPLYMSRVEGKTVVTQTYFWNPYLEATLTPL